MIDPAAVHARIAEQLAVIDSMPPRPYKVESFAGTTFEILDKHGSTISVRLSRNIAAQLNTHPAALRSLQAALAMYEHVQRLAMVNGCDMELAALTSELGEALKAWMEGA